MTRYVREAVITYRKAERAIPAPIVRSSRDVLGVLAEILPNGPQERFVVLGLDMKGRVVGWNLVAVGSMGSCAVDVGAVFRWVLLEGTVARIIVAHNHPSGDPTPSAEDLAFTAKLVEAGKLLGVPVLDHIVFAEDAYVSLLDAGKMPRG